MRVILHSLLIIAVAFVYVAGPHVSIEMEHSHEVSHDHSHEHGGDGHSHHPHDHGSIPPSDTQDDDGPVDDSRSHTHLVSLDVDNPFAPAGHNVFMVSQIGVSHFAAISESGPDGPYFALIMPPQLG